MTLTQRALLEAVKDLKERVAPSSGRCSEFKNQNETLNRRLEDLQVQITISREKLKKAKLGVQTEKEEAKRLRAAVERQRLATKEVVTEKNEMQAELDAKDREVSDFVSSLHPLVFHF